MIQSRLSGLSPAARELARLAAVVGRAFTFELLAAASQEDEDAVVRGLDELWRRRIVREQGAGAYDFGHDRVRDVAYAGISPARRRLLHRRVAEALEKAHAADLDGVSGQLAAHYEQAGLLDKAISNYLAAGGVAQRLYANEEAMAYYQQTLDLLGHPVTDKGGEWRLAALIGLGRVQFRAGQIEVAEQHLRDAIVLGGARQTPMPGLVRLYYWLSEALWWQGRLDEMLCVGQEGLALLGEDDESVEAALMYDAISSSYGNLGHFANSQKYLKRAAEFLLALPYTEELRAVYVHLVDSFHKIKDLEGAMEWIKALEQRATRRQDLRAMSSVQIRTGSHFIRQGDFKRGLPYFRQAVDLLAKIGDEKEANYCYSVFVDSHLTLGELEMAERYASRLLAGAETVGSNFFFQLAYVSSGLCALARRSWQDAQAAFARAAHYRVWTGDPAWATQHLGRILLAQGDRAAALRHFQDAIALAGPGMLSQGNPMASGEGNKILLALVLCGIDEAYRDPGRFRAFCDRFRTEHPEFENCGLVNWYLLPAEPRHDFGFRIGDFGWGKDDYENLNSKIQNGMWVWEDPFDDCSYAIQNGLEIYAANGRDLWHLNRSAPRLLQPAPEQKDWAAQTLSRPVIDDRPTIGGLLLWKDQANYLCLNRGYRGPYEISLSGCLKNTDVIIGRGRLPIGAFGCVFLRLERADDHVTALCSADGDMWFSVGTVAFPVTGPLKVGLHANGFAIGFIDRTIYPGAYPDGTAIRFESFRLWGQ